MYVVLGANGHVGSAVAHCLLKRGHAVRVVTRSLDKGERWRDAGAEVSVADVRDEGALRSAFRQASRAFVLNPPADPSTDTNAAELETVRSILGALRNSGLEAVVAESTFGARPGESLGDLSVLYELEQGLKSQSIPHGIIRAAYYMTNWAGQLKSIRQEGVLRTMFPAEHKLPMVSTEDIGAFAAEWLTTLQQSGTRYVEGPERYSSMDVAAAFSEALDSRVRLAVTPPERLEEAFLAEGFSSPAARSYARMTAVSMNEAYDVPQDTVRGKTTLTEFVRHLVQPGT